MYWLQLQDIIFFMKCFKDPSENFNSLMFVSFITHSSRWATNHKLKVKIKRTSHTHHFYFNWVVRLWNCLPPLDLSLFFSELKVFNKADVLVTLHKIFNPNITCSFLIYCPCSYCVNCNHSVIPCNYLVRCFQFANFHSYGQLTINIYHYYTGSCISLDDFHAFYVCLVFVYSAAPSCCYRLSGL